MLREPCYSYYKRPFIPERQKIGVIRHLRILAEAAVRCMSYKVVTVAEAIVLIYGFRGAAESFNVLADPIRLGIGLCVA
ncbi:protein of unknown function [Paraburkholderia dioscoreae]|uniref:Uncharacterized protein n=1 Tax=Paraburkholderia dioscoreae TaxID=2604047 RepID=A0A5Q4ZL89_9BURK|nr:protein of unknown function [Paraburkholderia dioscoreae]